MYNMFIILYYTFYYVDQYKFIIPFNTYTLVDIPFHPRSYNILRRISPNTLPYTLHFFIIVTFPFTFTFSYFYSRISRISSKYNIEYLPVYSIYQDILLL